MFENLKVYQKALAFAETAMKVTDSLPKGERALVDQIKRAALSIPLNIAEGNGRWHAKERKNFFLIARGSVFECVPLLDLCRRCGWIEEELHGHLKGELEEMGKMLSGLIKGIAKREQ